MNAAKTLWRLSLHTTPEAEESVMALMSGLTGCASAAWHDLETGASRVSIYAGRKPGADVIVRLKAELRQIRAGGVAAGRGRVSLARIRQEDWAESWKKHFPPFTVGGALLVKPSWSRRRPARNQAMVILDPGLSFGTGRHATTGYCLAEVVRRREPGRVQSLLDIGTGSGILAIAAAKLGYRPVKAFDNDPAAVRVARENARLNAVAPGLSLARGDVLKLPRHPARRYDVVCANLISTLLVARRRDIAAQVSPGGTLVVAGILRAEFALVAGAFGELGWHCVRAKTLKEWRSGSFRRDRSSK